MAFQTGWTKLLSLWHLHAQYAWLMVAPIHMCADWSYRCVPLVQHFSDPRNLQSLALYAWVLWALLEGRPWEVVAEMLGYSKVRHNDPEPSSNPRNLQSLALYAWVLWAPEGLPSEALAEMLGVLKGTPASCSSGLMSNARHYSPTPRKVHLCLAAGTAVVPSLSACQGQGNQDTLAVEALTLWCSCLSQVQRVFPAVLCCRVLACKVGHGERSKAMLMSRPCMQGSTVVLGNLASTNRGNEGAAAAVALAPARAAPTTGRWRSFVAWGLIIAPFIPASNLFFWVCPRVSPCVH